jgi:hypothetical protein
LTQFPVVGEEEELIMATANVDSAALDKQIEVTGAPKHGDVHQDVEVGGGGVDVERIEKVYE